MNPQKNTIWLLKDRTRRAVSPFFCLYVDYSFMFAAQCLCLCTSDYVFGLSVRSRLSFSFLWQRYLKNVSREFLQIWHQHPLGLEVILRWKQSCITGQNYEVNDILCPKGQRSTSVKSLWKMFWQLFNAIAQEKPLTWCAEAYSHSTRQIF